MILAKPRTCPWTLLRIVCLLGMPLVGQVSAQALSLSVGQLTLRMPEGGPLPPLSSFVVSSSRPWTATVSVGDMLSLKPNQGSGNATVSIIPAGWWFGGRKPGTYKTTITVSDSQRAVRSFELVLTVLPRQYPKLTYPDGPHGCSDVQGLPPSNAAVCVVPEETPPGNFVPPPVGGSYVDPNFGGHVRIISGFPAMHGYSTPSPVSSTNKYVLLSQHDESTVVELLTGKVVKKVPFGIQGTLWDAHDDNTLYYFSGSAVLRYNLAKERTDKIADYSKGPLRFQAISSGGTGEITKDNWLSFFAAKDHQACALDLNLAKTYCAAIPPSVGVDYTTMSKGVDRISGLRYLVLIPTGGPFLLYTVNQAAGRLDLAGRGPEDVLMNGGNRDGACDPGEACIGAGHSDTMEDSAGNQLLVLGLEEQTPCGFSMYTIQLNKGLQMGIPAEVGGGLKRVFPMFRCGGPDTWVDYHVGCAKAASVCVFSTTAQPFNRTRDPDDKTPLKRTSYLGEIMLMRDNGVEIQRLAEHRSQQFSNEESKGYWSNPRAAISADGSYVVATSNFGVPNQQRVIVIGIH